MNRILSLALAASLLGGCVSGAVKDQAEIMAHVSDGYVRNTQAGIAAITSDEKAATPPSVRALIDNMARALAKHRKSWWNAHAALNCVEAPGDLEVVPTFGAQ